MAPIISALSGLYKSLLYTTSGFSASGGTKDTTSMTGYTIHTFDTVGSMTFSVSGGDANVDIAVIGAGGGGGWNWGGGGGAGGVVVARDLPVSTGSYAITIGGHPGTRAGPSSDQGDDGSPSTFVHPTGTFTAVGGGGGGYAGGNGRAGGSGGGTGNGSTAGPGTQPGQSQPNGAGIVSNYGWPGASNNINTTVFSTPHTGQMQPDNAGTGGGGAGGQGKFAVTGSTQDSVGGSGGTGVYLGGLFGDSHPGLDNGYAAGGGGGRGSTASPFGDTTPNGGGRGGKGGGGNNNATASNHDGSSYGAGGAGNSSSDNIAGLGHKGAVLIRYKNVSETFTAATGGDAVLTKGNYKYHIYTSTGNGTFNVSSLGTDKSIDILVVGGGGGGTHPYGAGGGAGGVVFTEGYPLPATGTYNLRVGAGGVSAQANANNTDGDPSAFGTTAVSSPYPAYSLVAIAGGKGSSSNDRTPNPGGSGGGAEGNPGTSHIGGVGLNTNTTNTNAFLPQTSRWSGHGTTGGAGNPGGQYGAGGGGAWGTDVVKAGPTDNRGGMGMMVPDGFLPQPFAPWMPGKSQFLGMPISGNGIGLRMFGAGGSGGPSGSSMRNFGGGGGSNQAPTAGTTSNDYVAQPGDPGSGLAGRGGGGAGTNSDSNAGPGGGGSGSIIIRYKYQ